MQQMAALCTLSELNDCHIKHQTTFLWLMHACVAALQPTHAFLGNISSNFDYYEFLKVGDSLPYEKHAKLIRLINDTIERLQIEMVTKSITHYGKAPQSHN